MERWPLMAVNVVRWLVPGLLIVLGGACAGSGAARTLPPIPVLPPRVETYDPNLSTPRTAAPTAAEPADTPLTSAPERRVGLGVSRADVTRFLARPENGRFRFGAEMTRPDRRRVVVGRSTDGDAEVRLVGSVAKLEEIVVTTSLLSISQASDLLGFVIPEAGELVLSVNARLPHTGDAAVTERFGNVTVTYQTRFATSDRATLTIATKRRH